ncbi:uncharacterized protein BX663DRAFT_516211, partial [Cokeromyces recurvatus]|uniref:uncharacterized protein n=1 Tax=Cokeromyces recurvatus TaxID=90255 RepID=UPI00221F0AF9
MSFVTVVVSFDIEKEPIQFKFLSDKLTWDNLVHVVQSSTNSLTDPLVLYYKASYDSEVIESLENQEQLNQLLTHRPSQSSASLHLYGSREQVKLPVFVSSVAAFKRLGELVEEHKELIQSSHRIARWVSHLAWFISMNDSSKEFDSAFKLLEELIERKKKLGLHSNQNH